MVSEDPHLDIQIQLIGFLKRFVCFSKLLRIFDWILKLVNPYCLESGDFYEDTIMTKKKITHTHSSYGYSPLNNKKLRLSLVEIFLRTQTLCKRNNATVFDSVP